ncbi:uncharacterized protein LOC128745704 [Sabethes cyaneus]|uniref:uncharacterized protein LOC128745704 n=1 Tax=Sabethes cyaneus TaxID=53552 RepID=UPI00237E5C17|nr:uncharacterized protein LOC128745704 [Sabethes cyaneus]
MDTVRLNIQKYAAGGQEDNYCRLCFVKAFKLRCVFPYGDNPDNALSRKISELTLVKLNHTSEPDCCVCSRCVTILEEFSQFRQQCELYNRLLLEAQSQLETITTDRFVSVSIPLTEPDPTATSYKHTSSQETNHEDIDPFEDRNSTDVESEDISSSKNNNTLTRSTKRNRKLPKRFRKSSTSCSDASSIDEPIYESDDSFKPTRKARTSLDQHEIEFTPVKKKRGRKSKAKFLEISQPKPSCSKTKMAKMSSSSDFKLYNAGHGTINIVFQNYRYVKFRYYKTSSEIRFGWHCIERDCNAAIYTRSSAEKKIFWRERSHQHNHEPNSLDNYVAAKLEDLTAVDHDADQEIISSGRGRYNYSMVRLPSGEVVLVYGDHQHRLLTTKSDGTNIYGCTVSSCRALIYFSKDGDLKIYSGSSCNDFQGVSERHYRRSQKILTFQGYYYMFSGRKLENKRLVWHCYLRKSHNCPNIIYSTEDNVIETSKHQVKLPHNHELDAYNLEKGLHIVEGQKGVLPIESTNYHVAKNQLGTDFIIFEGLRYTIMNTRVDGTKACRCLEDDTCAAYIYLMPNGIVLKFIGKNEHSHPLAVQEKGIEEFDYVIETKHVERNGPIYKFYNGYLYKRQCRRENSTYYYRCTERKKGCNAAITCNEDVTVIRENQEPHTHDMTQDEQDRRLTLLDLEGSMDYVISVNNDGYEVLTYKGNRYCYFYYHKDGWRVWRCFTAARCRSTLFQNLPDHRIVDVEKFRHHHDTRKNKTDDAENDEEVQQIKEEKRSFSDSDSRESADWF